MSGHTSAPWRDVHIEQAESMFGAYNQPQTRRCSWHPGAEAEWMVSRTSNLTDRQYTDPACATCMRGWRGPQEKPL